MTSEQKAATTGQAPISIGEALDRGTAHAMGGDHQAAIGYFRAVLEHEPTNSEAMSRLGSSLFDFGRPYRFEALYCFWRALKLNRKSPMNNSNYGITLGELGHHDEAIEHLSRAIALARKIKNASPTMLAIVYTNLGNSLARTDQYRQAIDALKSALSFRPDDPFAHFNLGICLQKTGWFDEAIHELSTALDLEKNHREESVSRINVSDATYNRGICRLIKGDFNQGFEDYEGRLTSSENKHPMFGLPPEKRWLAEDLTGKTILVWSEQGFGDTIQFLRFLPALVALGARVQLVVQTGLEPLIAIPGVEVLPGNTPLDYDYWTALMSLPLMLGVTREDQFPEPWFPSIPDDKLVDASKWLDTLRQSHDGTEKTIVGVCWSGFFQHKNDAHRSIPLKTFSRLFDAPDHVFISLQQIRQEDNAAVAELGDKLIHPKINDWSDTAALALFLDRIVTVDTAVAHMAGSVGTPTTVLIPAFCTDWRWGLDRTDTPWYPNMNLWRQERIGDWVTPITRLRTCLNALRVSAVTAKE